MYYGEIKIYIGIKVFKYTYVLKDMLYLIINAGRTK